MTDEKIKIYQKIILKFWKIFYDCMSNDFGTDAMWTKAINSTGELQRSQGWNVLTRDITIFILDEMDKIQKSGKNPDMKAYYNTFIECGNSFSKSSDWDAFDDFFRSHLKKYKDKECDDETYKCLVFTEKMFDIFQKEIAKEFDVNEI